MKHAAKRVCGGQDARASRARSHAPLVLFSVAAATGTALFCAPQFSAFAQTGAAKPAPPVARTQTRKQNGALKNIAKPSDPSIKTTFPVEQKMPSPFASEGPATPNAPYSRLLPLSRIKEDGLGNATATQLVNRITSVALSPEGDLPALDQPLWLGTQYGVKRVQNRTARYYTPSDGLPGVYVEAVAADAKNGQAWCLVRPNPSPNPSSGGAANQSVQQISKAEWLGFCQWDSQSDTWRTIEEIFVPGPLSSLNRYGGRDGQDAKDWQASRALVRWEGKAKIAQSSRFVAFASSVVARDADTLVYLWDKKAQKLRPLGWETGLRNAPVPFVGVSFLHIDEARQTLWVGTSQGLYARSLDEKGKWRSYLAGRTVSAGAVGGRDKNALYLTCRLPGVPGVPEETFDPGRRMPITAPPTPGQKPTPIAPDWQLLRVALSTGETTALPTPLSITGPEPGGFSYGSLQATTPTGLYVDAAKSVWVTLAEKSSPSDDYYSFGGGSGERNRPRSMERLDLTTKKWERISLNPQAFFYAPRASMIRGGRISVSGGANVPPPPQSPTQEALLQKLDAIPSGALVPLTLTYQSTAPSQMSSGLISLQTDWFPSNTLPPEFWITHRFPQWYGASDTAAQTALSPVYRTAVADIKPSGEVDTTPDARLWMLNQDKLATIPRADLINGGGYRTGRVENIPFEATFTGLQTPLLRIVPASVNSPSLLIAQARSNFYMIDTETNAWNTAAPPDKNNALFSMDTANTALFPLGNGEPLLHLRRGKDQPLRRWNAEKQVWEDDARVPVPENGLLLGPGANGAAWFSISNGPEELWYQDPAPASGGSAPAPIRVEPPLPTEWRVPGNRAYEPTTATRPIAARGSHAYFIVPVRGDFFSVPTETGEDSGQQTRANTGTAEYSGGGRLPSSSSWNSLAGYDILTKKWTAPLPVTRNGQSQPTLFFSGDQTYAATTAGNPNGSVWQYNQTQNTWDVIAPPLPPEPGLFEQEEKPLARLVIPAAVTARYVWVFVVARMMARYDRTNDKWETISLPAALRGPNEENYYEQGKHGARIVAMGNDRFSIGSDKSGLWLLRVLPGTNANNRLNARWELLGQTRTLKSLPIDPPPVAPPAPGAAAIPAPPRVVSPPRQAEFYLSNLTVTPRFVWATGNTSGGGDPLGFVARWNKAEKTWTTWGGSSSLPPQTYIGSLTADGDSVWLSGQNGTYHYDESANRWDAVILPSERYGDANLRAARRGSAPLNGQIARVAPDASGAYLLLYYPTPDTPGALLWRWNRADGTLRPLPFPENKATPVNFWASTLLDEPGVLWVGTNNGLWAWDKKAQTWSKPALPAFVSEVVPNQIARSENTLILFGAPVGSERGIQQAVRLTGPPFLKRP